MRLTCVFYSCLVSKRTVRGGCGLSQCVPYRTRVPLQRSHGSALPYYFRFLTADSRPTHMPRSSSVIAKPHRPRPIPCSLHILFSNPTLCYSTRKTMFSHNVYDMLRYTICRRHAAMTRTNSGFANQMGLFSKVAVVRRRPDKDPSLTLALFRYSDDTRIISLLRSRRNAAQGWYC